MTKQPPTVRLRRLAAELRQLRETADLSHEQVAEQTSIARPTLYRIERARVRPQRRTVTALLDLYEASEEQRTLIETLHKEADDRNGVRPYYSSLPDEYNMYIAFEAEASAIHNYQSLLIPGLLQTEEYTRAMGQGVCPSDSTDDRNKRVGVRVHRQALLTRDADPLNLTAIIDEAALRRCVGGPEVMAGQLQHLRAMAERPNVSLHVIPYAVGAHPGMVPGSFVLMSFPDPEDPKIAYIESAIGDVFLDTREDVSHYADIFNTLLTLALGLDETLSFLAALEHELTR